MKSATQNLHVPLPIELHERLRAEAAQTGQPATRLAREAIELWLKHRKRVARHRAIAQYAAEYAGTKLDLDPELEAAAVQALRSIGKRGRR